MFKNYLKIAWRNLMKNKGYSAINIGGLAIGMACFLMIAMFIKHELSYDNYHENADNIYRVAHHYDDNDKQSTQIWGNAPVADALKADFPDVLETVQFSGRSEVLLNYQERKFQEDNCFYVDETVFEVFSWPLLSGNPETALAAPYSVVLPERTAKKYFGNQDPMGKTIEGVGGRADDGTYTVTGVMKDLPSNSHLKFDALFSMSSFYQTRPDIFDSWGYVDFYTYFVAHESFDPAAFQTKIPPFLERHDASSEEYYYSLSLERLKDAYLNSKAARQPGVTGSLSNIYIFAIIGLFILLIACINFMNLATARSMERAKEVGIRKVIGADKKGLIYQFFGESLVMVVFASVIGLFIVSLCLPWLRELTGKDFTTTDVFNLPTMGIYILTALLTGTLAGSYPALVLSGFTPVSVLKGVFRASPKGARLRRGLVVFQFSLSIALIASTAIVYSQMGFMLNKNLGFDREQMLVIDFNHDFDIILSMETIKEQFLALPEVRSVASSRSVPGSHFPNASTFLETPQGEMKVTDPGLFEVDIDFITHFGIEMVAGRSYSKDFPTDTISAMVVNLAAAKRAGYADPENIIGRKFTQWGREGQVIGVTENFNYLSLHQEVAPLALRLEPFSSRFLNLKINSDNLPSAIEKIRNTWATVAPERPFIYSFLDQSFNTQYEADIRFKTLFALFAGLAIFIACLGLLGLATYSAMQRTKEIGIRKVLGASTSHLVGLLSKDFVKLVLVAIIIATPFSWYAMHQWLKGYAYRIDVDWWVFAVAGFLAVFIAICTVSFHAFKSANLNPVKSLRSE